MDVEKNDRIIIVGGGTAMSNSIIDLLTQVKSEAMEGVIIRAATPDDYDDLMGSPFKSMAKVLIDYIPMTLDADDDGYFTSDKRMKTIDWILNKTAVIGFTPTGDLWRVEKRHLTVAPVRSSRKRKEELYQRHIRIMKTRFVCAY